MKLTKGKILKLYNKKKQTLKKINPNKSNNNKIKSLKNKKHINLANKSLKSINYKKINKNIYRDSVEINETTNEDTKSQEFSKVEDNNIIFNENNLKNK